MILVTGLLLGAVNTMFVLPKAFEGFEEGWGLLRIITAWGTILAQVLALGTPSAILRFLPSAQDGRREASMLTTLCILPAIALALPPGHPDASPSHGGHHLRSGSLVEGVVLGACFGLPPRLDAL